MLITVIHYLQHLLNQKAQSCDNANVLGRCQKWMDWKPKKADVTPNSRQCEILFASQIKWVNQKRRKNCQMLWLNDKSKSSVQGKLTSFGKRRGWGWGNRVFFFFFFDRAFYIHESCIIWYTWNCNPRSEPTAAGC